MFDQVDRVLFDLKNNPSSRRIITNMFNHSNLNEMALAPCAYSMTFNVTGNKLNGMLNQRSQDMLTAGCGFNEFQYSVLLAMIAQVSGFEVGEFIHVIADAHIYDRHIQMVEEILVKDPFPAPKLIINKNIKNFYDFRVDDFKLEGYEYHKNMGKIPVAI